MSHPHDDILLKSVLQTLNDDTAGELEEHLSACPACRARLEEIQRSTGVIAGFDPPVEVPPLPMPRARKMELSPFLKAAAILIVGFVAGYLTSEAVRTTPINVVRQDLVVRPPVLTEATYVICEQQDTGATF